MHQFKRVAGALALAIATLAAVLMPNAAAQASTARATVHGCPSGYVCVYPGESWNGDRPSLKYYNYRAYNFSNQFGWHYIYNNQTGGAVFYLCLGYGGTNCQYGPYGPGAYDANLTPINSILLGP